MDIHIAHPEHRLAAERPVKGKRVGIICPSHGFIQGDHCPTCVRGNGKRKGPNIIIFKPMIYEDICETPLLISSKRQLKRECKAHDVTAARLL